MAEKHLVAAGADLAALAKSFPPLDHLPPDENPLQPFLKFRLAVLTVDLDDQLRVAAKATFANEADAKEGDAAVEDALDLARGAFVQLLKQLSDDADAPKTVAFLKGVQAALRKIKVESKDAAVEVEASLKLDPKETAATALEAAAKIRETTKSIRIVNDLQQLAIAMQSFADANNGQMPASAIYNKNGKPLLSWRVLLLPYIEDGTLYKEFYLDEPWDSEHNKKLLEKMPETFGPKDTEAYKNHETFFQAFVGKGTVFEKPGLRFPADIPDGTSNTILFVEAKKPVPWTKPDDIPFDEGKLLPKVGGLSKDGFFAAMCDGSVRFIPLTVKEEVLSTWIRRNTGEAKPSLGK
jgi:Protein of unknown function (DUF1559)